MCLALNIYFEARDQPIDGQLMVAEVTLNRVASPDFPDNICDVVWSGAFSWTHDGKSDTPKDKKAFALAVNLAKQAINNPDTLLGTNATYFHNTSARPYWSKVFTQVGKVGDHIFYEDK
jgi:spore germination cell wall hydrolase CwlJ-like protein